MENLTVFFLSAYDFVLDLLTFGGHSRSEGRQYFYDHQAE